MKKIILPIVLLLGLASYAQVPSDSSDLRAKINSWLVTNGTKQITAVQLNQLFNGVASLMKSYAVDSGYRVADTLFLVRRGGFPTIKVTMATGGAASEADPTVPTVAKSLNDSDTSRWNNKQDLLTQGTGITIVANVISAGTTVAQWNANKIQGNDISSNNPSNGQVLKWNGSAWAPGTDTTTELANASGSGDTLLTASNTIKRIDIDATLIKSNDGSKIILGADTNSRVASINRLTDTARVLRALIGAGGGGGEANTASNQGAGVGVFKEKSGVDLTFKSLKEGWGINYISNVNDIQAVIDSAEVASLFRVDSVNEVIDSRIDALEHTEWYLDGNAGNDLNDGTSAERAVKTVSKLLTLSIARHDVVNIARGSYFREMLNLVTLDSIIVRDYGLGAKPILDAADTAKNSLFSAKVGTTNVYKITWTNNYLVDDPTQHSVWEDGQRLIRATSLANCDATPGSFFWSGITQAGTDSIYVHATGSSSVVSNGKLYEITRRSYGALIGDACKVYNIHTRRQGGNNGSFESGINSYISGVIAEDGVKHNFFMESGVAENCLAFKADNPVEFGGATMMVSYTTSSGADTMDVLYKNCIALGGFNNSNAIQSGMIGLYMHTAGVPYRSVAVNGGYWANFSLAIGGEANTLNTKNASFYNNANCVSKINGKILFDYNNVVIPNIADASVVANDGVLDSVSFVGNKISGFPTGGNNLFCLKLASGNPAAVEAKYNTVVNQATALGSQMIFIYENFSGGKVRSKYNFLINRGGGIKSAWLGVNISAIDFVTDSNYFAGPPHSAYWWDPAPEISLTDASFSFVVLSEIQGYGHELHSQDDYTSAVESRVFGKYNTDDFFLSKTDTLRGKYGSPRTYDSTYRYAFNLFALDKDLNKTSTKAFVVENVDKVAAVNTHDLNVYQQANFLEGATAWNKIYNKQRGIYYGAADSLALVPKWYADSLKYSFFNGSFKLKPPPTGTVTDSVLTWDSSDSTVKKVSSANYARILLGTTNWTPGTVAAGSSVTTTLTVTGAALGDPVTISKASGAYSNGEVYDAFVSGTNTVTIRVHNVSTGSANYNTSETYKVVVLKY